MALLLAGCLGLSTPTTTPAPQEPSSAATPREPLRYVAMGDSYAIGYGLSRQVDRWPNQLVRALRPDTAIQLVDNLAGKSDGTYEVIEEQLPLLEELLPDLVSLQVGVNDVVRVSKLTDDEYRANLETILDGVQGSPTTARAGILDLVSPDRVFLVTTPDYTLAPEQPYDRPGDQATIARFNDILREVAAARGVAVVDIAPISDLVPRDPTLLADDGWHPSAKQYAGWVELMAPNVRQLALGG